MAANLPREGVRRASSLHTRTCSCCGLHLVLCDEDGQAFAVATMDVDSAVEFSTELCDELQKLVDAASRPQPKGH